METVGSNVRYIDVLTIIYHSISYYEAEKIKNILEILPDLFMKMVPCEFLKNMKICYHRYKDLWDISQLEKLKNSK